MNTVEVLGRTLVCLGLCTIAGLAVWTGNDYAPFFCVVAALGSYAQWP